MLITAVIKLTSPKIDDVINDVGNTPFLSNVA